MRLSHCCKPEARVAYHIPGFHSFEGLFVSNISDHLALVDEGEGVTDSSSLLEPVGPAHGHALHPQKLPLLHWQHPMQLRLHLHTDMQT